MKIKVEAIQCKDCGRVGLSVEDIRVTSHKCSGAWKVIAEASVEIDQHGSCLAKARRYYDRGLIPELGLDRPIAVPRDERGNLTPIAELIFKDRNIAWYAVDIGDQKPFPIEGVGLGWFDHAALCALAARRIRPLLTDPTERVLPALLEYLNRCVSMPAR